MAQFARPDSDNSIGSWTDADSGTTNIYESIDETAASDADDIRSEADPSNSDCKIGLSDVTDPQDHNTHVVRYRYSKGESGGGQPGTIDLTVTLLQATTTIASQTHNDVTTTWTDGSFTLSGAEAGSITDYTDLFLTFRANKSAGARTSWGQFSWAELEVPNVAGVGGADMLLMGVG